MSLPVDLPGTAEAIVARQPLSHHGHWQRLYCVTLISKLGVGQRMVSKVKAPLKGPSASNLVEHGRRDITAGLPCLHPTVHVHSLSLLDGRLSFDFQKACEMIKLLHILRVAAHVFLHPEALVLV